MSDPTIPTPLDRIRGLTDEERRLFLCWLSGRYGAEFAGWLDEWQTRRAARIGFCRQCGGIVEWVDVDHPFWRHQDVSDVSQPHPAVPR